MSTEAVLALPPLLAQEGRAAKRQCRDRVRECCAALRAAADAYRAAMATAAISGVAAQRGGAHRITRATLQTTVPGLDHMQVGAMLEEAGAAPTGEQFCYRVDDLIEHLRSVQFKEAELRDRMRSERVQYGDGSETTVGADADNIYTALLQPLFDADVQNLATPWHLEVYTASHEDQLLRTPRVQMRACVTDAAYDEPVCAQGPLCVGCSLPIAGLPQPNGLPLMAHMTPAELCAMRERGELPEHKGFCILCARWWMQRAFSARRLGQQQPQRLQRYMNPVNVPDGYVLEKCHSERAPGGTPASFLIYPIARCITSELEAVPCNDDHRGPDGGPTYRIVQPATMYFRAARVPARATTSTRQ